MNTDLQILKKFFLDLTTIKNIVMRRVSVLIRANQWQIKTNEKKRNPI